MNHLYDAASVRTGYRKCRPVSFQYVTTAFSVENEMHRSFFQQYGKRTSGTNEKEGRNEFYVHGYYENTEKIDFHHEFLELLGAEFMSAEQAVDCERLATGKPKLMQQLPEARLPRWALRQTLYELMQGRRVALVLDEEGETTIARSRAVLKEIYSALPYAYRRGCGCMTNCTTLQLQGMKNMMSDVYLALMERCKDIDLIREEGNYAVIDLNDVPVRNTGVDETENQMLDFLCDAPLTEKMALFDAAVGTVEKNLYEKPELSRYVVPYELKLAAAGKATPGNIFGWGIRAYTERLNQNEVVADRLVELVQGKLSVDIMYDYFRQCGVPETLEMDDLEEFVDNPEKKIDYNAFYGGSLFESALKDRQYLKENLAERLAACYEEKLLNRMEKDWKTFPTKKNCTQLRKLVPVQDGEYEEDRIAGLAKKKLHQIMQDHVETQDKRYQKNRKATVDVCNKFMEKLAKDFAGQLMSNETAANVKNTLAQLNTSGYLYDAELKGSIERRVPQFLMKFEQSAAQPTSDAEYEQREESISQIEHLLAEKSLDMPEEYRSYTEDLHQEWREYTQNACKAYADEVVQRWNGQEYQLTVMKQLIRLPEQLIEKARLLTQEGEEELRDFYKGLCRDTAEKVQQGLKSPETLEGCREWYQMSEQVAAHYTEMGFALDKEKLIKPAEKAVKVAVRNEIVQRMKVFAEERKGHFGERAKLLCTECLSAWAKAYPECIHFEDLRNDIEKRYIKLMIAIQRAASTPCTLKECCSWGEAAKELLNAMETGENSGK